MLQSFPMRDIHYNRVLLIGGLLLINTGLIAQKAVSDSVIHFSHRQLDSVANSKRVPNKPGRVLDTSKEKAPYMIVVRLKAGDVEIHEQYDDVTVIRSGAGTLRSGYHVKGGKQTGNAGTREWLGGEIEDKRDRKIAAGDFLTIPAMLAHQYIPNPGDSLTYFVIKVKHPPKGKP